MRYYADTAWWLGYKCRADTQHQAALSLFDREPQAEVLWTSWQRVEVLTAFARPNVQVCFAKENLARSPVFLSKKQESGTGPMSSSTGPTRCVALQSSEPNTPLK